MSEIKVGESGPERDDLEDRWLPRAPQAVGRLFRRLVAAAGAVTEERLGHERALIQDRAEERERELRTLVSDVIEPFDSRARETIMELRGKVVALSEELKSKDHELLELKSKVDFFDGVIVLQGYEDAFAAKDEGDSDGAAAAGEEFVRGLERTFRQPVILVPNGIQLHGVGPLESKDSEHRVINYTPEAGRLP